MNPTRRAPSSPLLPRFSAPRRRRRWPLAACCLLGAIVVLSGVGTAAAQEVYEPGPVRVLHDWLGGQCTFAPDLNVGSCCQQHDIAYQEGGSERDRLRADRRFRRCVRAENGPIVADIYYSGVRAFGWAFFNYH